MQDDMIIICISCGLHHVVKRLNDECQNWMSMALSILQVGSTCHYDGKTNAWIYFVVYCKCKNNMPYEPLSKVNNFTHFIHLGDACTLHGMGWCEFSNYPIVISLANDFRIFVWLHNYNDFPKWISKIRWLHIKCRCNRRMSLAATIDCIRLAVTLSGNNQ